MKKTGKSAVLAVGEVVEEKEIEKEGSKETTKKSKIQMKKNQK